MQSSRLNQEQIENLDKLITSNEVKSVIKNKKPPNKQKYRTGWFHGSSTKHLNKC